MWQHWRLLQWCFLSYAILTGFYAFKYDFKARKFRTSRLLQVYSICCNIFVLLLLPIQYQFSLIDIELYESFPVAKKANLSCTLVRTMTVFLAIIMRIQQERCLRHIVDVLSHIEVNYFNRIVTKSRRYTQLNLLLYGKLVIWIFMTLYAVFAIVQQWWLGRLFESHNSFVVINLMNLLQVLALYHYIILWHICKRFHMINDQLSEILRMATDISENLHLDSYVCQNLAKQLAHDLFELSAAHAKLTQLLSHMNDKFKFKLLMIVLSYFVNYVTIGYYTAIIFSLQFKDWNPMAMLISVSMYVVMIFNAFLLMVLSEDTVQSSANMSNILQQFIALPTVDTHFERSSEIFSLQLLGRQIAVNIFGFFDVNRRTAFAVLVQVSLYTIVLVQSDYKNLYFDKPKK